VQDLKAWLKIISETLDWYKKTNPDDKPMVVMARGIDLVMFLA
jgi:hypothetical protein